MNKKIKNILGWIVYIVCSILIVFLLSNYVFLHGHVSSNSMYPTVTVGDNFICIRENFNFNPIKTGDIIVFNHIKEDGSKSLYVKRVIGIPGDKLYFKNDSVYVNDIEYNDFAYGKTEATSLVYNKEIVVPEDCYFVLGDNREHSLDSRYWDYLYVNKSDIVARTLFIK